MLELDLGRGHQATVPYRSERKPVKRKPDLMLILAAAFAVGVLLTLLLPLASNNSVAGPVSELQAGVILPK
jgi:hypothetical protein